MEGDSRGRKVRGETGRGLSKKWEIDCEEKGQQQAVDEGTNKRVC